MPENSPERNRRRRANGEGSIYQRASDRKWVGSAYVYTTTGQRRRKTVYGNSFDEVREKLDRLKGDSANGVLVPHQHILMSDYLKLLARRDRFDETGHDTPRLRGRRPPSSDPRPGANPA
jgi:hypothetical protein